MSEPARLARCGKFEPAGLGQKLLLRLDDGSADWGKVEIAPEVVTKLSARIDQCESRGSCQVYEELLSKAKPAETVVAKVEELKKTVAGKLEKMETSHYVRALASVGLPCARLRQLGR